VIVISLMVWMMASRELKRLSLNLAKKNSDQRE
jgi:hypothetical protein